LFAVFATVFAGGIWGTAQADDDNANTEQGVTAPPAHQAMRAELHTEIIKYQSIADEHIVDAQIEAIQQAMVAAQTSGEVVEILFDVNDTVNKGDIIVRLRSTEQIADLAAVQAQIKEAKARQKEASGDYKRFKKLSLKNAIAASKLDASKANLAAAKARLAALNANLKKAREQVKYTEVKAPYTGIVLARHVQVGEIAKVGSPVITGFSLDNLRAIAQVPQSMINNVRKHPKAYIRYKIADKQRQVDVEKLVVIPYVDKGHSFKVRLQLPEKTPDLYPGMFVKAVFQANQIERLLIPASSVTYRGEIRAVYVVEEDEQAQHIHMRQVRLGDRYGDQIEILSGLKVDEKIALDPIYAVVLLKEQRQAQTQKNSKH